MITAIRVTLLFIFSLCWAGCRPAADQHLSVPPEALIVYGGTIIDGTGAEPLTNGCVIILKNRILAVGQTAQFNFSDSARIIDAEGGTILPGIINSHIHHGADPAQRKKFLKLGITSVCDLGSSWQEIDNACLDIAAGEPAARLFYAGPIITAPGGYPDGLYGTTGFNLEVSNPEEGRKAVRDVLNRGAHVIKIALDPSWNRENPLPMLDVETAAAIAEQAHQAGILVRAHMIQLPFFPLALEADIDVIEHMPFPPGWPTEKEIKRYFESADPLSPFFNVMYPEYDTLLTQMAEQSIIMVPTVSALLRNLYGKPELTIHQQFVVKAVLDIIRRFKEAGGIIALGNDFNDRFIKERMPLIEMKALLDAGLTSMEVIVASTRYAARVCGQENNLGTLEVGKLADIIIVDGDPLTEIEALTRVKSVILDGKVIF
jgi:imidazolonepropionase-like amidohydrolase